MSPEWHTEPMTDGGAAAVDAYIAGFPPAVAGRLEQIRATALGVVSDAGEKISYGVPTITVGGKNVFHFAGFAGHLSTYPVPQASGELSDWIESRRAGKGTLHYSHEEPLPLEQIAQVVRLLLEQRP